MLSAGLILEINLNVNNFSKFAFPKILHHFERGRDITILKMFFQKSTGPNMLLKALLQMSGRMSDITQFTLRTRDFIKKYCFGVY